MAERYDDMDAYKKTLEESDGAYDKVMAYLAKCQLSKKQKLKTMQLVGELVNKEIELEKFCNR